MSEIHSTAEATVKRLFFALWPDQDMRTRLFRLGGELLGDRRGRRIPPENLHLTLAFLGDVNAEHQGCLEREAAALQTPSFTLMLEQAGFWPRKQLLWAGGVPPAELLELVRALNQGLANCGLETETRPFRAHLTLARNARSPHLRPDRAITPLAWHVREFALVAAQTLPTGARYEVLRSWPLR
jgi:2'-5' RNA ligase